MNHNPLVLLSLLICSWPASAQVYSWQDAQGRTHYSDRPPTTTTEQQEVRELDIDNQPISTVGGSGLRPGEQAMLERLEQQTLAREQAAVEAAKQAANPPTQTIIMQPPAEEPKERIVIYRDPPRVYKPHVGVYYQHRPTVQQHPIKPPVVIPAPKPLYPMPWPPRPQRPTLATPKEQGVSR